MLKEILLEIFERDLDNLAKEIEAYEDENKLWLVTLGTRNSGGNLALHLIGNLRHYVGGTLGNSGYVRNRDAEFAAKGIPKSEILGDIHKTKEEVLNIINGFSEDEMSKNYPIQVFHKDMSTSFFLIHLTTHLGYHLGQINYHRRMI